MNDAIEILAVAIGVALVFSVPFAFFTAWRYLRYKETVELARQGLLPPARRRKNGNLLRWGVVILVIGIGLSLGFWPIGFIVDSSAAQRAPLGLGPWMLPGIVPTFFGLALVILHFVNQHLAGEIEEEDEDEVDPIPPHKQV